MQNDMPFSPSRRELVERIESAVLDAARYLVGASTSGERPDIRIKADHTMVMNLDVESQRRILALLGDSHPIVAEEDESSHRLIHGNGSYFVVDPLDGTTSCKRFLGQLGGQVGYGPLVGYVENHQLTVAAFYSVPHRTLFTAVRGEGCYKSQPEISSAVGSSVGTRTRLQIEPVLSLVSAGMLFFVSKLGEVNVAQFLKGRNAVENLYRFGGFANDSARLAQGFEQVQLQFQVKPWDLSAVLLAQEAGLEVWCDPMGERIPLDQWRFKDNNPILVVDPSIRDEFFSHLAAFPK